MGDWSDAPTSQPWKANPTTRAPGIASVPAANEWVSSQVEIVPPRAPSPGSASVPGLSSASGD